jgi:predicted alpha/beta-fold hydrolase
LPAAHRDRAGDQAPDLPRTLGLAPFRQRLPWFGADLQTLRDVLRPEALQTDSSSPVLIPLDAGDQLLARLDLPAGGAPRALVLLLPGLGSGADALGPRRLALALQRQGFASLRLNPRGAGEGRSLAGGSYAAACNRDLLPVLRRARSLAADLPLAAVGISLGGTMLLNLCRDPALASGAEAGLDALVTLSSPLDLAGCTERFEQPRNAFYQRWLVRRLRQQVLADARGLSAAERAALSGPQRPRTIRAFDALITAPRWGHASVADYHRAASPLPDLRQRALGRASGPPTLLLHAADDPWVPAGPARALANLLEPAAAAADLEVLLTRHGGHCGFHAAEAAAAGEGVRCSWAERVAAAWLALRLRF